MSAILTVVDHASNFVPADIDLGIDPALLKTHIAWDIGAAALARALGYPCHLGKISRLVVDLNREETADALVPVNTGGHLIWGNMPPTNTAKRLRFWHDYHNALAARIGRERPTLLLSLHSFTPIKDWDDEPRMRPWEVGVLYNNDDRAARIAIPLLEAAGVVTGDQLPYSGKVLNATMNRHGEATKTPYLGLEVRQDLIADASGVTRWADRLRPIVDAVAGGLA